MTSSNKRNKIISVGDFKIGASEKKAIKEVLDIGRISEGKKVFEFEGQFADFIGTKYSVLLNSGTAALISGINALCYYKSLNISYGQKIITTPLTYIATCNAIVASRFVPVFVDIEKYGFNIDPAMIREHLKKAKDISQYAAILPVHLMGTPCDMEEINRTAKEYGLQVLEDSSQAHGTIYKKKKVGSLSLLSSFSFYVAHNIQVGEMGAITTDDHVIASLVRKIKANGRLCCCHVCTRNISGCVQKKETDEDNDCDPRFTHDILGYNFKTTEFSAALGVCQLKKVDLINKKRKRNVSYLNMGLNKFGELLQLPIYSDNISYLAYPVIIRRPDIITRKFLRSKLEEYGVETRPLFGCIPTQQPAYGYLSKDYNGRLPNAERIGKNGFYIGCHQYLQKQDLDYVVYVFEKILKEV